MTERTILLVEDNRSDALLTQRALTKGRVVNPVVVARDGQEALDWLFGPGADVTGEPQHLPALVLLDLKMPRLDGFEVLRAIRRNEDTRRIPVVILTSSSQEEDIARGYDLHANSYLRKPVDFARFVEAMTQVGAYWLVLNEPPPSVSHG